MSRATAIRVFARPTDSICKTAPRNGPVAHLSSLQSGDLDIIAGNSTDGLISALDLFQLADDKHYFPPYQAVFIARRDV